MLFLTQYLARLACLESPHTLPLETPDNLSGTSPPGVTVPLHTLLSEHTLSDPPPHPLYLANSCYSFKLHHLHDPFPREGLGGQVHFLEAPPHPALSTCITAFITSDCCCRNPHGTVNSFRQRPCSFCRVSLESHTIPGT